MGFSSYLLVEKTTAIAMKQTAGVSSMKKEDKQELVADEQAPGSTVVVIPDRESNVKVSRH